MHRTAAELLMEKGTEIITISGEATVYDTIKEMTEKRVGSIFITDADDSIAGIWTERDLLRNSLNDGFNLHTSIVKDVMTTGLKSVPYDAQVYQLFDHFLGLRLRHLLVERDGDYIGVLSTGDVMKETLRDKNEEYEELNKMVSWEYYENWNH